MANRYDWVPIPHLPKEEYYAELEFCKKNNIPIKLTRLKKEDGKEYLMVSKKISRIQPF
jgi:hypothetical protein